ncbi:MAG: flagellar hook basal-body protein [Planctomycetes bacterium]|nr:flagellar hook basal-body protein [Planctomycetota bacterium]
MYRQDVWSNNLANVGTAGFKADYPLTRQRDAVRTEDGLMQMPSNQLLERLGGGLLLDRNRLDFSQGSLETTGDPFHVGVEGDGFFLVKESGDSRSDIIGVTRDGRFLRNAQGVLVQATSGLPVLDEQNRPITISDEATVKIQPDGTIIQNNERIARLAFVEFPNKDRLIKRGEGLFGADSVTMSSKRPASGKLVQGAIEQSSVDEVKALLSMQSAARDVSGNAGMIQAHDRTMDRAINVFGRLS